MARPGSLRARRPGGWTAGEYPPSRLCSTSYPGPRQADPAHSAGLAHRFTNSRTDHASAGVTAPSVRQPHVSRETVVRGKRYSRPHVGSRPRDGSYGARDFLACRVERRHPAHHAPLAVSRLRPLLDPPLPEQPVREATAHLRENAVRLNRVSEPNPRHGSKSTAEPAGHSVRVPCGREPAVPVQQSIHLRGQESHFRGELHELLPVIWRT